MSIKANLVHSIYPLHCLDEARAAYADLCSVTVFPESPHSSEIEITAQLTEADDEQVAHEFLNYLLNLSIEYYLGASGGRHGANEV